jgi:hypothetical protein
MHHRAVGSLEGTRIAAPLAIGQLVVVGISVRLYGLLGLGLISLGAGAGS